MPVDWMVTSARTASTFETIDAAPVTVTVSGSTFVVPTVRPSGTGAVGDLDPDVTRRQLIELDGRDGRVVAEDADARIGRSHFDRQADHADLALVAGQVDGRQERAGRDLDAGRGEIPDLGHRARRRRQDDVSFGSLM